VSLTPHIDEVELFDQDNPIRYLLSLATSTTPDRHPTKR
jgi:hypothetical protein